ncbi:MAG: hypothetical protein QM330_04440 [Acidobacteriota bacterium]|jgi:hypothetical protein|nr:hypothetical protein [Acidobacteriota bacterium]NLT33329.1 hypothetical protein [Acidobacteriota bacterium]
MPGNDRVPRLGRRVALAMAGYAVLIGIALALFLPVRTGDERFLLGMLLVVIALFIVKTLLHAGEDESQ